MIPHARKASQLTAPYSFLVEPSLVHQERSFKDTKSEVLFYLLAILEVSIAWFATKNRTHYQTKTEHRVVFNGLAWLLWLRFDLLLISTMLPYAAICWHAGMLPYETQTVVLCCNIYKQYDVCNVNRLKRFEGRVHYIYVRISRHFNIYTEIICRNYSQYIMNSHVWVVVHVMGGEQGSKLVSSIKFCSYRSWIWNLVPIWCQVSDDYKYCVKSLKTYWWLSPGADKVQSEFHPSSLALVTVCIAEIHIIHIRRRYVQ